MIKIAICDDETTITSALYHKLSCLRPEYAVKVFNSSHELLNSSTNYDIIFLDIEMPETDGMETAKLIRKRNKNTYIIFLTSHTEYMAEAFKVRAYRFLVKPVSDDELKESVTQAELEILGSDKITVKVNDTTTLLSIDDIVCVEAFGDGSIFHMTDRAVESNKSLKYWAEQLPVEHFCRVHKTYLAAFRYVDKVDSTEIFMYNMKQTIPISRRNQSAFKKAFLEYIKKYSKYI